MTDDKRAVGVNFVVPLRRGWFGAGRVISARPGRRPRDFSYVFLVLDGFWRIAPEAHTLAACAPMAGPFREESAWKGWFKGTWPSGFKILTATELTPAEREHAADESGTMVFQSPDHFAQVLLEQWRWRHDRDAFMKAQDEAVARHASKASARREGLTLEHMARERPFSHWGEHWPKTVVAAARKTFADATRALMKIKGRSARARTQREAVLRGIVDTFNELEARHECIETTEREEVVARIEELARLAGVTNAKERLTGHRDW